MKHDQEKQNPLPPSTALTPTACSPEVIALIKAVKEIQRDAEIYGLAGSTNVPAVRCEVKGLTLGHWYNLEAAMEGLRKANL